MTLMATMAATARAPGKLVLLGEYAVLEGGPAWVAAVDRMVTAEALPREAGRGSILHALGDRERVLEAAWSDNRWAFAEPGWALAAEAMTAAFGAEAPSLRIDSRSFFLTDSTATAKAGFGSSAAVVASILRLGDPDASADDLFARARAVHHAAQGNLGSGIDIAASVYGGVLAYRLENGVPLAESLPIPPGLALRAVWMGAPASTPELVGRVLEWKTSSPLAFDVCMGALVDTAADAQLAVRAGDASAIVELAGEYGRRLEELGVASQAPIVTAAMRELAAAVGRHARVKPSGAGGGDVALVFATTDRMDDLDRRLAAHGACVIPLGWGAPGATGIDD